MTTIYDIKKRAQQLSEKTDSETISPQEVGGLFSDLADYTNDVEVNGSSLGIRKTYTSVSAMEADKNPVGDDGKPLKKGQLVNIYNQDDPSFADNNKVFSWQNPGWQIRTTLDAGYATREELTELEKKVGGVGYVTCDTAAEIAAKVVTVTGLTALSTAIRLLVKMTNNNTANNATLNINSLGEKTLYYNNLSVSKENSWESEEVLDIYYDGTNFYANNVQGGKGEGGNKIVEWDTNAATTRKSVKSIDRKVGMQISYIHPYDGWINEQYIGKDVDDENWVLDKNWQRMSTDKDLALLKDEIPKEHVDVEEDGFYLIDKNGNIGFGITPDGTVLGGGGGSSIDLVKVDEFND